MRSEIDMAGSMGRKISVDEESAWIKAHLIDAERGLIWTRRAAFAGWGIILYAQDYPLGPSPVWISYSAGLLYMITLHWWVKRGKVSALISWSATICDSIITFIMCSVTGGISSPFLPFFYFTTLAGAFRFGTNQMIQIILLNGAALVSLHLVSGRTGFGHTLLNLFYLGFAAALGAMLAEWARANLEVAMSRTAALRIERDRSNALLGKLMSAQEEERNRIADELHDRMGAKLFHIQHHLDQCRKSEVSGDELNAYYDVMRRDLVECNSDVRSLMNDLRPNVLDDFGFVEALSEYITSMIASMPFAIEVQLDSGVQDWRSQQDAMLFRLLQEALLNVRKHACASRVVIAIARRDNGIELKIADDGQGFDISNVPLGHFGIMMMRERAKAAGGDFSIASQYGAGTQIRVTFRTNS